VKPTKTLYRIKWCIEIDATSHQRAAELAQEVIKDPELWANNYEVEHLASGDIQTINILEDSK
tara:strand:- start:275 stop:463 length:189 start_codon:yes stop_codon:yes gene_type:complete